MSRKWLICKNHNTKDKKKKKKKIEELFENNFFFLVYIEGKLISRSLRYHFATRTTFLGSFSGFGAMRDDFCSPGTNK